MLKLDWKAWLSLAVFVIQNGCSALIMRYAKTVTNGSASFSSTLVVLVQEFALKLPFCMVAYSFECGGVVAACSALLADVRERRREWLQLSVPALLYTVQNTMMYVGYANLEAAIGMVTYQTKILFTAVCSVLLLGKRLSQVQWLSLLVLFSGVLCVQGILEKLFAAPDKTVRRALEEMAAEVLHAGHMLATQALDQRRTLAEATTPGKVGRPRLHHAASGGVHEGKRASSAAPVHEAQNPSLGVAAFIIAAICTSFASVYFEKMLKGASKPSLWLRNIQLASYSSVIAFAYLLMQPGGLSPPDGLFAGFGTFAWLSAFWQALGGIIVAVTIKYADNILRGFAQALAIIVGAIGSSFLFGFVITPLFMLGVSLVISAVFMYGAKAQTPMELCFAPSVDEESKFAMLPTR